MHNDILQIGGVNTNIIAVGQCLPEECSNMSCIKYKFIDENLNNKSKNSITTKTIPLKVSINTDNSQSTNDKKIINATKTKNDKKDNMNEQKELDLIKSELYQKHQQDNLTRELKQEKRRLEGEVNELKTKLVKYEKANTTSTIDKSEISSSLECPLCADIILNAAILSCSHGFCMSCIESYWRKDETNKVARLQRKVSKKGFSTCPVCADNVEPEPDKSTSKGLNDKSISFEHLYHRSLHLDSICSLLYDDQDILKERERRSKEILTCYGVNVDKSRSLKADHDNEEEMKIDDNQARGNNDPLCILCGNYHDAFVPCALNDETEDDEDEDDDDDEDD